MTSTVDLAPLLLTIASGSSSWRSKKRYSHLAPRADIAQIAANPSAAGRPWIAHITDETTVEELSYTYSFANQAPHHVAAVRTPSAKYAVYSPWKDGTIEVDTSDQGNSRRDRTHPTARRSSSASPRRTSSPLRSPICVEQAAMGGNDVKADVRGAIAAGAPRRARTHRQVAPGRAATGSHTTAIVDSIADVPGLPARIFGSPLNPPTSASLPQLPPLAPGTATL